MVKVIQDELFLERIFDHISINEKGCWLCDLSIRNGYSRIRFNPLKYQFSIHRLFFWIFKQNIPKDKVLDHLCKNLACCNPEHLEIVSQKINNYRGSNQAIITHLSGICKRGHVIKNKNAVFNKITGEKQCRECLKDVYKRYNNGNRKKLNW